MTRATTVVFRICAGCDTPLGLQLVPWVGIGFESSHALCAHCDERVRTLTRPDLDDRPPFDVRSAA